MNPISTGLLYFIIFLVEKTIQETQKMCSEFQVSAQKMFRIMHKKLAGGVSE